MLNFWQISQLDKHISLLKNITQKDIFLVWWCVRDILLWMSDNPIDVDATCAADPQDIFQSLQKNAAQAVWLFRTEKFWTATIILNEKWISSLVWQGEATTDSSDEWWSSDVQYTYEITPFREESGYTDRRHPTDIVRTNSLIADAWRRDFTVNSLYYTTIGITLTNNAPIGAALRLDTDELLNQLNKQGWSYIHSLQLLILQHNSIIEQLVVDWKVDQDSLLQRCISNSVPYNSADWIRLLIDAKLWLQDMGVQKIRTVGDPDRRFNEDALRILRALRFVNIRNQKWQTFDFYKETRQSIKRQYHLIQYLAKERIHDELVKVFSANNPFWYVALLDEANLLQYIFPSLARCKGNEQPIRYHPFDTYAHILLTLWNLQKLNTNYLVKLGMLYHDVGKPDQYYYYAQCKTKEEIEALHWSWYNHIVCWAEFAQKDFEALAFSSKEIEEISWYVAMHMRPWQVLEARTDNQLKKVRVMYSEFWYDRVKNIFDICKADRLWQFNPIQSTEIDAVEWLYKHLNHLRDSEWQFTMKEMIVDWEDVMKEFDLKPGKEVWDLLQKAFQRVLHEKDNRNTKHAILAYLKGIITHGN